MHVLTSALPVSSCVAQCGSPAVCVYLKLSMGLMYVEFNNFTANTVIYYLVFVVSGSCISAHSTACCIKLY